MKQKLTILIDEETKTKLLKLKEERGIPMGFVLERSFKESDYYEK